MDDGVLRKLHFTILKYENVYFNLYLVFLEKFKSVSGKILRLSIFENIDILIIMNMSQGHGRKGVITTDLW